MIQTQFNKLPQEIRDLSHVLSPSSIITLFKSPKHYYSRHILKEGTEPTKAMEEGSMIHKAVLEPDDFLNEYVYIDEKENFLDTIDEIKDQIISLGEKPVKGRKGDLINQLLAINPNAKIYDVYVDELMQQNKKLISKKDFDKCMRIVDEVKNHKWLSKALQGGMVEQSAWWEHELGVLISMRMDFYHPAMGIAQRPVIIDLKKSRSADPRQFNRQIWDNGLFIQAAMYVDGVKKITGQDALYCWAVVEAEPPYAIEVFSADDGLLEAGRSVYGKMIMKYLECKESGIWPGYTEGRVNNISLPPWAFDKLDYYADMELENE